jgi:hypothetical protein
MQSRNLRKIWFTKLQTFCGLEIFPNPYLGKGKETKFSSIGKQLFGLVIRNIFI